MNSKLYQKFYIKSLIKDNNINNYTESIDKHREPFPNIPYNINEEIFKKIKIRN